MPLTVYIFDLIADTLKRRQDAIKASGVPDDQAEELIMALADDFADRFQFEYPEFNRDRFVRMTY